MASVEEAVARNMADGQSHDCKVDGHDFDIERIGRSRQDGVVPRTIKVEAKIVHDYSFPQSDDDIFVAMTVTQDSRATIQNVKIEGGLWSFDDVLNAARGLPGLIVGGPLPVIALNVAIPRGDSWQAALVKVIQAVGQGVWAEYFG